TVEVLRAAGIDAAPATEEDYAAEFLDLILSAKVVDDLDGALGHIARYGSGHTEAIVTEDLRAARRFADEVDASAVLGHPSTALKAGGSRGRGAEMGISTANFHARAPCGLLKLPC